MSLVPDRICVLERGWLSSNNIVFLGDEPCVVDTGHVSEVQQTQRLIDTALGGRPLKRIINTHLHSDHAGGNAALQAHHGCATWIPSGDAALVDAWDEARLSYRHTSQPCPRFTYDAVVQAHSTLRLGDEDWTVLPAAGHDHAMVMLWCERLGLLISADALWQKGFGIIFAELAGASGFAEQQATLDLIAQLQARVVIPGHGAPFDNVNAALQTANARLQWLRQDPRRHADHALKALMALKLLDTPRMTPTEAAALVQASLEAHAAMSALYSGDMDEVAAHIGAQLVQSGVARRDGTTYVSTS